MRKFVAAAFVFAVAFAVMPSAQGQGRLTVVRTVGPPNDGYKAVF